MHDPLQEELFLASFSLRLDRTKLQEYSIAVVEIDWHEPGPSSRFRIAEETWKELQREPFHRVLIDLYRMARQTARKEAR